MKPAILGIDLGRAAGWAVLRQHDGALLDCGAWDLSIRVGEGAGMPLLRLRRWVREVVAARDVLVVGFEMPKGHGVSFRRGGVVVSKESTKAAHLWGMMAGAVLSELEDVGLNTYAPVAPTTLKKRATGKGNADKDSVIRATRATFPDQTWPDDFNDNVADAVWVAVCTREGLTA